METSPETLVQALAEIPRRDGRGFTFVGTDRVELYTGPYAWAWGTADQADETRKAHETAQAALEVGLGLNAGHDLDRFNLEGFRDLPGLLEVSIGHAQVCRALEVGTTVAVQELLVALGWPPQTGD